MLNRHTEAAWQLFQALAGYSFGIAARQPIAEKIDQVLLLFVHSVLPPATAPPVAQWVAAITMQRQTGYSDLFGVTVSLASIVFGYKVLLPYVHKAIPAEGLTFSAFTGTFQTGLQLRIVQRGHKLYRQKDGSDDIELIPESTHKFFYGDGSDRQIDFIQDRSGNVSELLLIESGLVSHLKKVK